MRSITVTRVVAIIVLLLAPRAFAADDGSCGGLPCRADGTPYVSESGGIIIKPGESFSVELTLDGDKVTAVKPRAADENLANSILLKFESSSTGLTLSLQSQVDRTIKIDMFMKLADGRFLATSSCPLAPKLGLFEMWQDRIVFLELRNFRTQKDGGVMACS